MWTSSCVCVGELSTWKNWIIVRKQRLHHRMHVVTLNIHIVTDSNLTMQSNYRTSRIPILLPKSSQIRLYISQLEPGIQDYNVLWAFFWYKPSLMLVTTWRTTRLTMLHISKQQTSKFYDHHARFVCLLALFLVTRGLAIAALLWMLYFGSSCRSVFV